MADHEVEVEMEMDERFMTEEVEAPAVAEVPLEARETVEVEAGDSVRALRTPTLFEERYVLLASVLVAVVVVCAFGGALLLFWAEGDTEDGGYVAEGDQGSDRTVILVSIDALRWSYLEDESMASSHPNLSALMAKGVASRMQPCFPSSTFPNHYSIVTGLYPESHGIVANHILDPATGATYDVGDEAAMNDPFWYEAEALWSTLSRQGVVTASMFWPGNTVQGMQPNYTVAYDEGMSYSDRVTGVLAWLDLEEALRPRFVTLYMEGVDHAGHDHGPDSTYIAPALAEVDAAIGQLVAGLEERRAVLPAVNLLVVSDHGMAAVDPSRTIPLDAYIDMEEDCQVVTLGPFASIYPKHGRDAQLYDQLKDVAHMSTYRKADIPAAYHYRNNERIPGVLAVADEGWCITTQAAGSSYCSGGAHGYNNTLDSMAATFIGQGDFFSAAGTVCETVISNLDLYSLMAHALGCTSNPNNGTWTNLFSMLA